MTLFVILLYLYVNIIYYLYHIILFVYRCMHVVYCLDVTKLFIIKNVILILYIFNVML